MMLRTNEKGSSLLEVLGVLGVVATMTVGLYSGIAGAFKKFKINSAHQQVTDIVKNMRVQFSAYLPADLSPEKLEKIGIYPNGTVQNGVASHVFGSEMKIETDSSENSFTLTYTEIPNNVCSDLLQGDWGSDPSSGLKEIKVLNGSTPYIFCWDYDPDADDSSTNCHNKLLPEIQGIQASCYKEKVVSVSWTYYL